MCPVAITQRHQAALQPWPHACQPRSLRHRPRTAPRACPARQVSSYVEATIPRTASRLCKPAPAAPRARRARGPPAAGRRRAPPPRRHAAPAPAHVLPVGVLDCQQVYMSAGSTRLVIICALSITLFHHHLHLHGAHAAPSCHTLTGPAFIACAAGQGPAGALRPINIFGVTASCMFPRLG